MGRTCRAAVAERIPSMPLHLHGPNCQCSSCSTARVTRAKGAAFGELVRSYAPLPFANGAVPTGASFTPGSSGFLERVVDIFPEFGEDAARMKWSSSDYVYAFPVFFRA